MSEVKVNKLSPRSGTTVTLGDSGDTISIPSGVTLSNAGTNTFASATITGDLTVDTTTLKVDSTNNRVGIGTSSPGKLLSIQNTDDTAATSSSLPSQVTIFNLSNSGNVSAGIAFGCRSIASHYSSIENISAGSNQSTLVFKTENTDNILAERMRINSAGNVGIGTTSPSQKLDVVGSIEVSDGIYIGGTGTANKLDDYEEGYHTVTCTDSGGGATITMNTSYDQLAYTKIGRVVHISGTLLFSSISGSFTGTLLISIPFTVANLSKASGRTSMSVGVNDVDFTTGSYAFLDANETNNTLTLRTGGDSINTGQGRPLSSAQIYIGGSYLTDA